MQIAHEGMGEIPFGENGKKKSVTFSEPEKEIKEFPKDTTFHVWNLKTTLTIAVGVGVAAYAVFRFFKSRK